MALKLRYYFKEVIKKNLTYLGHLFISLHEMLLLMFEIFHRTTSGSAQSFG